MGKANNILGITGTIGGIIFKKNGTVSQKPPKRGKNNLTERVKQNMSEFEKSAKAGKIVRKALAGIKKNFAKGTIGKVVKIMREYLELDTINVRGERGILDNNVDNLSKRLWEEGIYLRELIDIWKTGPKPTVSIDNLGNITTNIAIWRNLILNPASTHLYLAFEVTRLSFEVTTGTRSLLSKKLEVMQYDSGWGGLLPYFNENPITPAGLNFLLAGVIPSVSVGDQIIVTVKLEQYQKINGRYSKLRGEWTLVETKRII